MANQMTPNGLFGRKTSLFAAGLLAATASLALLPTTGDKPANAMPKNPVMAKVLADARKHRNKGRYKQAAKLAQMFRDNFKRYESEVSEEVRAVAPRG